MGGLRGGSGYIRKATRFVRSGTERAVHGMLEKSGAKVPYYVWKSTIEARRSMNRLSERGIGPRITDTSLLEYKSSDTLFVLGSGSSINDITDEQWRHIDEHDSIGLNRWPVHGFTPTYHVFEISMQPEYEGFVETYWALLNHRKEQYSDIPVVLKDTSRVRDVLEPHHLPEWLRGNLIVSCDSSFSRAVTLHSSRSENDRLLRYLDQKGYFDRRSLRVLYRMRGSISYLVHLGVVLGYRDIVLCGVDMVDSRYFFDAERYVDSDIPIPRIRPGPDERDESEHKTNDPEVGSLTLEQIIYSMNETVLQPRRIGLYVENDLSALHPDIPLYEY